MWRSFVWQIRLRFSRELCDASPAEACVGHVGHGPLPTGVAMVIVEPDSVDLDWQSFLGDLVQASEDFNVFSQSQPFISIGLLVRSGPNEL